MSPHIYHIISFLFSLFECQKNRTYENIKNYAYLKISFNKRNTSPFDYSESPKVCYLKTSSQI